MTPQNVPFAHCLLPLNLDERRMTQLASPHKAMQIRNLQRRAKTSPWRDSSFDDASKSSADDSEDENMNEQWYIADLLHSPEGGDEPYRDGLSSCSNRASSRSIPIPRSLAHKEADLGNQHNEERRYELATWALYERIVAHRKKNPYGQDYTQSKDIFSAGKPASTMESTALRAHLWQQRTDPHVKYYDMDDAIFEMEL